MKKIKAFSLIELLTVVAIISILATIGVSNYTSAVKKGRDTARKADIYKIQQALLLYRADVGKYPALLDPLKNSNYLNEIPHDRMKKASDDYQYSPTSDGKTFVLCTGVLEFPRNSANSSKKDSLATCNNDGTSGTENCKYYCVTNP